MRCGAFLSSGLALGSSRASRCRSKARRPRSPGGDLVEQGFVHRSPMRQSKGARKGPLLIGGQGGIRTLGTAHHRSHTFQACAFSHSATCPRRRRHLKELARKASRAVAKAQSGEVCSGSPQIARQTKRAGAWSLGPRPCRRPFAKKAQGMGPAFSPYRPCPDPDRARPPRWRPCSPRSCRTTPSS